MTLVVDASVVAEILLSTGPGTHAASAVRDEALVAPDHLTAEVASAIRGWALGGHIGEAEGVRACEEYRELGIVHLPTAHLMADAFALRHNLSAYDALYVALARALGCRLLTLDARLAGAAPDCCTTP